MTDTMHTLAALAAENAPDATMLAGAACVTTGAALIYAPAGWIVGGLLLIAIGLMWAGGRK